jgi:hypothetical protein
MSVRIVVMNYIDEWRMTDDGLLFSILASSSLKVEVSSKFQVKSPPDLINEL